MFFHEVLWKAYNLKMKFCSSIAPQRINNRKFVADNRP